MTQKEKKMNFTIPNDIFYIKKKYKSGEFIFSGQEENPNFYLLISGEAEVIYPEPGGEFLKIDHFKAPDFFGEIELLTNNRIPLPIVSSGGCETLIFSHAEAIRWMKKDFSFCRYVMERLAQKLYTCTYNRAEIHFLPIRQRLLLIYSRYKAEGRLNELTKQDLCAELGVPIRSLNRVIAQCSDIMVYEHKHFRPGFSFGDGSKMQKAGRGTPGTRSPAGN